MESPDFLSRSALIASSPLKTFDLDLEPEIVGAVGIDQGLFERNPLFLIQMEQDVVERLTAFLHALFHRFFERIDFGLLDEILNAGRVEHDFQCRGPLSRPRMARAAER